MEILKRKLKTEREVNHETMTVSIIDNIRLCIRLAKSPERDMIINFTAEETKKIKNILN